MSILISVLAKATKVKRIYAGVEGKARRVTHVYAPDPDTGLARLIFEDTTPLKTNSFTFNFGNLSPYLCAVYSDSATATSYRVVGTFENKYMLTELTADSVNGTATKTGTTLVLGSESASSIHPTSIAPSNQMFAMVFTGASNDALHMVKVLPYSMSLYQYADTDPSRTSVNVETGSSFFTIPVASSAVNVPLVVVVKDWSSRFDFSTLLQGTSNRIAGQLWKSSGTSTSGQVGETYQFRTEATLPIYGGALGGFRSIVLDQDGASPKILVSSAADASQTRIPSVVGYTDIALPNLVAGSAKIGRAISGQTTSISGSIISNCLFGTISYNTSTTTCGALIVDYVERAISTTNTVVSDVVTYLESSDGVKDGRWYLMGIDNNYNVYILSSLSETLKIIKLSTANGAITKVSEFDTGVSLGAGDAIQEPVPLHYGPDGYYPRPELSFVINVNNEYNKLIVVKREEL